MAGLASLMSATAASAQTSPAVPAPIAPSQVTPRTLRPSLPTVAAPVVLKQAVPTEVPAGSEAISLNVARIVVEGDFPELAATTRTILAPLENRMVTVAALYRGAGAIEKAYSDAGYFLARVVIPEQRLAEGATFRIQVVDGFIERVDTSGLPRRIARPVTSLVAPVVGRRHLTLAEMERRLDASAAIPGTTMRSTLARGEAAGGARLILEGRHRIAGASLGGDNRIGPSFRNWGLNLQGQLNSPLGLGEQFYLFLAGDPRLTRAFRSGAPRRVVGFGVQLPLTPGGLVFNPEVTVSDTNPIPGNPLLATTGRLYRGALALSHPLRSAGGGSLTARATLEFVSETQRLPFFEVDLSRDRLTVLRGGLSWTVSPWLAASLSAGTRLSHGLSLFGARTRSGIARSETPSSRGSDPRFTVADAQVQLTQAITSSMSLAVIARAQTAFGSVLPSSELFDLAGLDALSPYSAGGLSADRGASMRGEVARNFVVPLGNSRLQAAPYLFGATGLADDVIANPFLPSRATAFGAGLRLATSPLLFGASPNLTFEYGHVRANRGVGSSERLSILYGVSF